MVDDEKELQENIPFPPENTGVKVQKWKAGTPMNVFIELSLKGLNLILALAMLVLARSKIMEFSFRQSMVVKI